MKELIFLIITASIKSLKNTTFYIGQELEDLKPFKIKVFIDITFNSTIISSNDFICNETYDCSLSKKTKEMVYEGEKIFYREGLAQINLVNLVLFEKLSFKYIENDVNNFGSVIGFVKNSEFLNYLFKQNKKNGFKIIMRIDWQNNLIFKNGIYEIDKLPIQYDFQTNIIFPEKFNIKDKKYKFCITNRLDIHSWDYSIMGVKEEDLDFWKKLIKENYNKLSKSEKNELINKETESQNKKAIIFNMFDNNNYSLGNIYLSVQELYNKDSFKIKSFNKNFDNGKNCDIYTGTLLLKKYNFKYYYIEYDNYYEVKLGYDNFKGNNKQFKWLSFTFKVIFTIILIGCIITLIYKYFLKPDEDCVYEKIILEKEKEELKEIELKKNERW